MTDLLTTHAASHPDRMVWCGLNSIGVVEFVDAARRIGATAAPLKYRLSDDGAAYVTDHSGAGLAYVDVGGNV